MRCLVCLAFVLLAWEVASAVTPSEQATLTGDTSRPEMSLFTPAERVTLTFTTTGLPPEAVGLKLRVDVVDEHDRLVQRREVPVVPDPRGAWQTSLEAPGGRLGFYRVRARLSNGVELARLGSRAAGFLTYAVVPDPRRRKRYPQRETSFGMQGGFSARVNVMPYLGIRWVLGGYAWRDLEPERAGQIASQLARRRAEAPQEGRAAGADAWRTYPMPTLFFAPAWAVRPETLAYCTGTLTPEGEAAWQAYCEAAARAFAAERPDLEERIYQVTWEPVYPWGFKGTDEDLVRIYQIAHPAIHRGDPRAVVVGPTGAGVSRGDIEWNERLLRKGLGRYLDAFSIHPYHALPPERLGLVERLRELREVVRQHTRKELRLLGTEQGWATGEDPAKELDHARGLLRESLIMLGEGFSLNFAFYIADYPTEPGYGYFYNLNPAIPWGTDKIGPKPIAPGYAFQSFLLEGHRSAGSIEWLGETALGYAFERGSHVVLALWDWGDAPRPVSVPVGMDHATVYDWMGRGRTVRPQGGLLRLTLGPEPLYVEGVSPRLWGSRAVRPVEMVFSRLAGWPGAAVALGVRVSAPAGAAVDGQILFAVDPRLGSQVPPQRLRLSGGKRALFQPRLRVPGDAEPGLYPVRVTLAGARGPIGVSGAMLVVRAPVEVVRVEPCFRLDGQPGIRMRLHDATGIGQRGTLSVRLKGVPETSQRLPFRLPAGGSAAVTAWLPGLDVPPTARLPAVVRVATSGGHQSEQSAPISFLAAHHMARPPVVDGALDEWRGVPAIALQGRAMLVRSPQEYRGAADLAAWVRLAWDARCLYLAVEVHDDVHLQPYTGFDTWKGDCLQCGFDLDPYLDETSTGNLLADAGRKRRASEVDLALTASGPEAYRTRTFDPDQFGVRVLQPAELPLAVARTATGLCYEAAVPWQTLGRVGAPGQGSAVGIALTVNDMDDPSQRDPMALGLFGGITPVKDPRQFGIVVLGGVR